MATPTVTTNKEQGIGYQTNQFAVPAGAGIFDTVYASRLSGDPVIRAKYYSDIVGSCGISSWMEQFGDVQTDCFTDVTLLEYNSLRQQIKVKTNTTIPAYPATGTIALATTDHSIDGQFVLPREGNSLILPPTGKIVDIITVTHATANDTVLTVRHRSGVTGTSALIAGDEPFVLTGSLLDDCECPEGTIILDEAPIEHENSMINYADKMELCGDDLDACRLMSIPFYDSDQNPTIYTDYRTGRELTGLWWEEKWRNMVQMFENRKDYETLFNDKFGLVPLVRSLGLNFVPASSSEITVDDFRAWVAKLDQNGIYGREYAVRAGTTKYSQFMRLLDSLGVTRLAYERQPMNSCKWMNLDWCGIEVEGLVLHIYKECAFSNGRMFGGANYVFPNSALFIPMWDSRSPNKNSSMGMQAPLGYTNKLFSRVYFRSKATGEVFDSMMDSDGILNGQNGKNTYGVGCRKHAWSIQSRWRNDYYNISHWGYMGL